MRHEPRRPGGLGKAPRPAPANDARPEACSPAERRALYRSVNANIVALLDRLAVRRRAIQLQLHCECGSSDCAEMVRLRRNEYERVRASATRFLMAPGHAPGGAAQTVLGDDRCAVVELPTNG